MSVVFAECPHESQGSHAPMIDDMSVAVPGDVVAAPVGQRALWRRGCGRTIDSVGRIVPGRELGSARRIVSVGR